MYRCFTTSASHGERRMRMPLVPMKDILQDAVKNNYAVGAFGGSDMLSAMGAIRAAEACRTPLILLEEFSLVFDDRRSLELHFIALNAMIEKVSVPVATVLDHGVSYEDCVKAIELGCTSVMFDGSALPMEENIRITSEVVRAAHEAGVSVEGEIGHVGGAEGGATLDGLDVDASQYSTPEAAKYFAEQTGVDALAVAIGTVHGTFKGTPKLDIERLREIRAAVGGLPLVLHGGSGLPQEEFRKAIHNGINKINIFTSQEKAGAQSAKDLFAGEDKYVVTFDQIAKHAVDYMQEDVERHIKIFETPADRFV